MLRWRLIVAATILIPLCSLVYVDYNWPLDAQRGGTWLLIVLAVAATLACGEIIELLRRDDIAPRPMAVYGGVLLILGLTCVPLFFADYPADCPVGKTGWPLLGFACSVFWVFLVEMRFFQQTANGKAVMNVGMGVFAVAYVGLLMSFLALLRFYHSNQWGMMALVSMMFVVKVSDSGAYAIGRMAGKHPIAPVLSPKKTWEGAVGGLIAGCLSSWAFFAWFVPTVIPDAKVNVIGALVYGLLLTLAAMVGDLAESMLKRDANQKDSSRWMVGLGGVLDILDSILAASPVAFLCWAGGLVGP